MLLEKLDVNAKLIAALVKDGMVTQRQGETLKKTTGSRPKVQVLLEFLKMSKHVGATSDVFLRFLNILEESGQEEIKHFLQKSESAECQVYSDLDTRLRIKFQKCRVFLLENVKCKENPLFMSHFEEAGILNESDMESIQHEITNEDKVATMLDFLERKVYKEKPAYEFFLDILQKLEMGFVKDKIDNTEVTTAEIQLYRGKHKGCVF